MVSQPADVTKRQKMLSVQNSLGFNILVLRLGRAFSGFRNVKSLENLSLKFQ